MTLWIEGDKEKIKRYRVRAERDGLTIILYSEESKIMEKIRQENKPEIRGGSEFMGLYPTQQEILKLIKIIGSAKPSTITRELSHGTKTMVSYNLRQLDSMGYVKKTVLSHKHILYELTEKGNNLFE